MHLVFFFFLNQELLKKVNLNNLLLYLSISRLLLMLLFLLVSVPSACSCTRPNPHKLTQPKLSIHFYG